MIFEGVHVGDQQRHQHGRERHQMQKPSPVPGLLEGFEAETREEVQQELAEEEQQEEAREEKNLGGEGCSPLRDEEKEEERKEQQPAAVEEETHAHRLQHARLPRETECAEGFCVAERETVRPLEGKPRDHDDHGKK